MKKPGLLVALAAFAFALPAHSAQPMAGAPAGADAPRGVPFHLLQRQLDKLRERVQALEAQSPAGQVCPDGQFITGFSSTGSILCAAPGGTPTPPPPPQIVPIPDSAKAALQQALNSLAGQNLPLLAPVQTQEFGGGTFTWQPLTYDLAVGTIQVTQPSATSAIIQLPIPNIAVDIEARYRNPGIFFDQSGTIVASASGVAVVQVTIVTTPSGARRIGSVTAVDLIPTSLNISGAGIFGPVVNFVIDHLQGQLVAAAEQLLLGLVNTLLPLRPDF
jgi:hypothetical protein